jgi:uncharacterized membrane protein
MTARNASGEWGGSVESWSKTTTVGDGSREKTPQPEERNKTMIKHSIEINRPAGEVFAYLDQVDRHNEWQGQLVSTTIETGGPIRVGTRAVERRNVPGGARDFRYEITEHHPARKISFRGTAGLIRPVGTYTVDPIGESSSRMNSELDLEGHGIGKLFAILARRQAAKQVPVDLKKFKELLESGVAPAAIELTP